MELNGDTFFISFLSKAKNMMTDDQVGQGEENEILCQICKKDPRKYKCPRCGMSTCSLLCCKQHKVDFGCSGQREKSQFVSTSEFTDNHLRRDFHFLEDVLQTRIGAKRQFTAICGEDPKQAAPPKPANVSALNSMSTSQNLAGYNRNTKSFVKAGLERNIKILLQPVGMSRRKENTSRFDMKKNIIFWKIAAVFLLRNDFRMSEVVGLDVRSLPIDQTEILHQPAFCLHINHVSETENVEEIKKRMLQSIPSGTPLKQAVKQAYSEVTTTLRCFLRIHPSPADSPLFREVDLNGSIRDALSGMTVIEFPTMFFAPPAICPSFRLLLDEALLSTTTNESSDPIKVVDHQDSEDSVSIGEDKIVVEDKSEDEDDDDDNTPMEEILKEEHQSTIVLPQSTSPSLQKRVTFGGLLADYSSDSDSDSDSSADSDEETALPLPLPGSSNRYRDLIAKLTSMPNPITTAITTTQDQDDCMFGEEEDERDQ